MAFDTELANEIQNIIYKHFKDRQVTDEVLLNCFICALSPNIAGILQLIPIKEDREELLDKIEKEFGIHLTKAIRQDLK